MDSTVGHIVRTAHMGLFDRIDCDDHTEVSRMGLAHMVAEHHREDDRRGVHMVDRTAADSPAGRSRPAEVDGMVADHHAEEDSGT